jgi:hypothetical protein
MNSGSDPLAPDAPLIHHLSVRHNPLLITMSDEELTGLVLKLREPRKGPPKKAPKPKKEPKTKPTKPSSEEDSRRQMILDSI